jgi:hypothetical protein
MSKLMANIGTIYRIKVEYTYASPGSGPATRWYGPYLSKIGAKSQRTRILNTHDIRRRVMERYGRPTEEIVATIEESRLTWGPSA